MINIFQKIGAGLIAIAMAITGFFSTNEQIVYLQERINNLQEQLDTKEDISFGAFYPMGGKRYALSGSGVGSTDTSIELRSFQMPISDQELVMTDFGEIAYATLDPGNPSKKEFISFTGITQSGTSDKATLTGVSRGLSFTYPYSASTTLAKSHSGGSVLILSNSPAFYSQFPIKKNDETITGTWTFDADAFPLIDDGTVAPTLDAEFATKKYADDLTNAGAADSTISVKGIVEVGTLTDLNASNTWTYSASTSDTTAEIFIPAYFFSTSTQATTTVVVTESSGLIAYEFLNKADAFSWTGIHDWSAQLTFNGSTTFTSTTQYSIIPTVGADPTLDNELARKAYVDTRDASITDAVFGDGSDGAVTIWDNTTTTRDMYYNSLTLSATSSPVLDTNGYRIFIRNILTVGSGATIENKGDNAGATSSQSFGAGGEEGSLGGGTDGGWGGADNDTDMGGGGGGGGGVILIVARSITNAGTISVKGGDGADGINTSGNASNGVAGGATTTSLGGNGGTGGTSSPGTGGAGGATTAPSAVYGGFRAVPAAIDLKIATPAGTTYSDNLIKGGGGGGGGGVDNEAAKTCGGGGGGGGAIVLIYKDFTDTGTVTVAGGAGGTGVGDNGDAGTAGTKIEIEIY